MLAGHETRFIDDTLYQIIRLERLSHVSYVRGQIVEVVVVLVAFRHVIILSSIHLWKEYYIYITYDMGKLNICSLMKLSGIYQMYGLIAWMHSICIFSNAK